MCYDSEIMNKITDERKEQEEFINYKSVNIMVPSFWPSV